MLDARRWRRDRDRPPRVDGVARDSATVSMWTLVSRATGLLRVVAIGAVLGPTFFANVFLSTNVVPNLIYSAVAGPVLGLVVVPAVVRVTRRHGAGHGRLLIGQLSSVLLLGAGVTALLTVVVSPVLAWSLTLGVPDDQRARMQLYAVLLLLFVAPQVPLYVLAALGAAAQQARGRFALAAAAPAMENIGLIAVMGVVALTERPGPAAGDVSLGLVVLLGVGATASVALHAALQIVGAARAGLLPLPRRGWRSDPETREIARRLRRSVSVAAFPAAGFYVLLALAATVAGGVLVIQMAHAVYGACAALGARAITTAVLPGLSAAASEDDRARYAASWRRALSFVGVVGLPTLLLLAALAGPITTGLATGELAASPTLGALTGCLVVMAVAQLAAGVHEIGRQALFARLDVNGPRLASALSFAGTALTGGLAVVLLDGNARLVGVAAAVLVGDGIAAATVFARVRTALRPEPPVDLRGAGPPLIGLLVMAPPLVAAWALTTSDTADRLSNLLLAAPLGALAVGLYALAVLTATRRFRAGAEPSGPRTTEEVPS